MIRIDWNPSRTKLRCFSVLQGAFALALAAVLYGRSGWVVLPAAIAGAAALAGVMGWLWPTFGRWMYLGWTLAGFPIGWLVSHAVLAALFYLVFTPVGLFRRLCGHDPMQRRFDRGASTYWVPRPPEAETSRYFRQF
jgi:hypothetical protein